ncbi:expressed unknown protein [Seminavis robusta]|uniref:Uncharacterized protein n=1 Tax=Seminavis robusta TaxID=568900 RepID=A0A9N8EY83_9STRA|nr:expressed unknown protein [Seminavis robusta]|eukprot:Sro2250_g320800.1 n/a (680) ;mRNA; r:5824-8346
MEDQSTPSGPSSSSVCSSSGSVGGGANTNSSAKKRRAEVGEMADQAPCVKKPKLTRKELLEQAKARLREAQEKKKLLQQKLEEEQAEQQATSTTSMNEDYFYYHEYDYEYHIPPVTGSKDSLLITHIESTGPAEKVRFQKEDEHSCIEAVMTIITNRRRSLSPSNNNSNNNAANPQGPPQKTIPSIPPPPRETISKPITSEGSTTGSDNNPKPAALDEGLKSQRPTHYHKRTNSNSNGDQQLPHPAANPIERRHSHTQPTQPLRMPPRQTTSNSNNNPRTNRPQPPPPSASGPDKPKENPRRNSNGPQQLQQSQQQRPPSAPPQKRPWTLALAQVTGRTIDFTADLPTKTPYLIRTQDQGVVAHVQFFSSPDNPALLQHHPSKRHLQDHFAPIGRLPSNNSSQSWKGQEVLSFLKHQDERRKTYQPPARRNLPFTHWALLDLEQPLHQAIESLGYFTAAPAVKNNGNGSSSSNNDISFAGKLIWNMHDFYQQRNNNNNAAASSSSKLSKWGEVVSAVATSGIRNSPLIATVQGFYESAANTKQQQAQQQPIMPPALRARKVILPKSRTIGIIIGSNARMSEQPTNNNPQVGCCQVLFPNGMASGPPSAQSLKGARAILRSKQFTLESLVSAGGVFLAHVVPHEGKFLGPESRLIESLTWKHLIFGSLGTVCKIATREEA